MEEQRIQGRNNAQVGGDEIEQAIGDITRSRVTGANISGSDISINELPCELLLALVRIIERLLNERKGGAK
jgi:hypothetical protein